MQSCQIVSKNLGWRQNQWRMKTELATNAGILALQAAILKIKGMKPVHSRQNQAQRTTMKAFLAVISSSAVSGLRTALCSAGRVEDAPFSLRRVWAVTLDIFNAIKTRCFSAVLFLSPGEVWGPLRNRRVRDPVSLVSGLSGVMEHRAFGVVTWLVAPFPFGTFLRAQDCRILIRGDFQAWCLTRGA